jgi:GntR family transcriptional regulator
MLAGANALEGGRRRKLTVFQPARSARVYPLTSSDALRGRIPGRRRLLCACACRGRTARNPRTGADGEGVCGYAGRAWLRWRRQRLPDRVGWLAAWSCGRVPRWERGCGWRGPEALGESWRGIAVLDAALRCWTGATPLYVQVARLRARIESGELVSRLPRLRTITQEYGVSRITAEKAVQTLREDGLVVTVIGRGTFVARPE